MSAATPGEKLASAVAAVNWADNVDRFAEQGVKEVLAQGISRLALWSKHLETADLGNAALVFIREMQAQAQSATVLIALGLYKPAASSMRAMFESALYYTYFRSHPLELQTLVRDSSYFVDKKQIFLFHNAHTPSFKIKQEAVGLTSSVDRWYSTVSAVIHGQIPGKWVTSVRIDKISFHPTVFVEASEAFEASCTLIHSLFLCTVEARRWTSFTHAAKIELLKGLTPEKKSALGLTAT